MAIRGRILYLATCAALLAPGAARAVGASPIDPELIARRVARNQRMVERRWGGATYDLFEIRTSYSKEGRPKEIHRRLYYVLAAENGGEGSRELVEVDGRPASPAEIREAAEEDATRRHRIEERAAKRASAPPGASDGDDDPFLGDRRLSELLSRYELTFVGEDVVDGRPAYVLDFAARPGLPVRTLADRALASMRGRVVIDAGDLQIQSLEAHLTRNLKVAGGLAANVKDAGVDYRAVRLAPDLWFPCRVDLHVVGKTAIFFRFDSGFRFEFANLRSFRVDTEAVVEGVEEQPPRPAPR
jgi:hypothetical protein